jgi:hypothetical protein
MKIRTTLTDRRLHLAALAVALVAAVALLLSLVTGCSRHAKSRPHPVTPAVVVHHCHHGVPDPAPTTTHVVVHHVHHVVTHTAPAARRSAAPAPRATSRLLKAPAPHVAPTAPRPAPAAPRAAVRSGATRR